MLWVHFGVMGSFGYLRVSWDVVGCCGLFSMTWRRRGVVMDIFGVFWVLWHILDVFLWAFLGARLSCGVVGSSGYFRVLWWCCSQ